PRPGRPAASDSTAFAATSGRQIPPHCHADMAANPAVTMKQTASPAAAPRAISRGVSARRDRTRTTAVPVVIKLPKSAIFPGRVTLLDERADAFLGVARHHVLGHHLGGVAIGFRERQLHLAIERSFADADHMR